MSQRERRRSSQRNLEWDDFASLEAETATSYMDREPAFSPRRRPYSHSPKRSSPRKVAYIERMESVDMHEISPSRLSRQALNRHKSRSRLSARKSVNRIRRVDTNDSHLIDGWSSGPERTRTRSPPQRRSSGHRQNAGSKYRVAQVEVHVDDDFAEEGSWHHSNRRRVASGGPRSKSSSRSPRGASYRSPRSSFRSTGSFYNAGGLDSRSPMEQSPPTVWDEIVFNNITDKQQISDMIKQSPDGIATKHRAHIWFRLSGAYKIFRKTRAYHEATHPEMRFPEGELDETMIYRYYVVKALKHPTPETAQHGSLDRDLYQMAAQSTGLAVTGSVRAVLHRLLAAASSFCDTFFDARGIYCLQVRVVQLSLRTSTAH